MHTGHFQLKAPNTQTCTSRASENYVFCPETAKTPPFNFIFACTGPCIMKILRAKFQLKIPTTRTSRSRGRVILDLFFFFFFFLIKDILRCISTSVIIVYISWGYRTTLWLRAHAHWPKIEKPEIST